MATFANILGDNSYGVAAAEAEEKLRSKEPLLLHENESIQLAFKSAFDPRDKSYLTSHRVLIKDGKGIGHKRKNFLSIPYTSIDAFSVETAGSGILDHDCELKVWTSAFGQSKLCFGKEEVDIFSIQQFMNANVLPRHNSEYPLKGTTDEIMFVDEYTAVKQSSTSKSGTGGIFDWLGNNAKECNAQDFETVLKEKFPVLLAEEKVELAFRCWRDFTVFTNQRIMIVDVQGITGKRVEFKTIPWSRVQGYAVETAGSFMDRDSDMTIFTNIGGLTRIKQDFRKGKADLWAIKQCINNKIIGRDKGNATATLPSTDQKIGHIDPDTSWWGRDNNRPLDAAEMQRAFQTSPAILQADEVVEMAFKGRRDIILFTTRRVLKIDPKGWSGTRVEYTSLPWHSVIGFAVKTAGKHMDNDSEVMLWTEMPCKPGEEPEPYMAMWELDFSKKLVDIIAVKLYLSKRCLNACDALSNAMPLRPNTSNTSQEEKGFQKFLSRIGDDQRAIDPTEMNTILHTELPILLDNENVVMAFKAGRDATFFTNLRVLIMDVQGWSGQKVEYQSIPYKSIRAFSAESAGSWDRDSQIQLYTRNLWSLSKVSLDFRKGKADIIMLQKFLSAIVLGTKEEIERYFQSTSSSTIMSQTNAPNLDSFLSWMTSNTVEVQPDVVSHQLHSDPPILLDNENCEKAYRSGRDMYVYTNLRLLKVDVQGLTGKKVEYLSIPLKWIKAFEVETAGHMDRDAEVYLLANITDKKRVEQDILIKCGDVMEMHKYLTNKLLVSK